MVNSRIPDPLTIGNSGISMLGLLPAGESWWCSGTGVQRWVRRDYGDRLVDSARQEGRKLPPTGEGAER